MIIFVYITNSAFIAFFLCPAFSEVGHTKLPLSFRPVHPSVCLSEICYQQLLINYPLDCYETWLDCSLGWEYVH